MAKKQLKKVAHVPKGSKNVTVILTSDVLSQRLRTHSFIFAITAIIYIAFALLIGVIVIMTLPVIQRVFATVFTSEKVYLIWTPLSSVFIAGLSGFCMGLFLLAGIQKMCMKSIPSFREYILFVKKEYYQLLQRSLNQKLKVQKKQIDSLRAFERLPYFTIIICFVIFLVFILYLTALCNYAAVSESGFMYRPYLSITGEFHTWDEFDYALVKPQILTGANNVSSLYLFYFLVSNDGIRVNIADNADISELLQVHKLLQKNNVFIKRGPLNKQGLLFIQNLPLLERQKINELLMIRE